MQNKFIVTPYFLDSYSPVLETLAQPGWTINKPSLTGDDTQQRMTAYQQPLADFVTNTLANGERPVSIAGDCCTAIACLAGLQRAGLNPTLLWLDAHGDFNTWETTPSGFLGGMPLAMLVGRGEQTLPKAVGLIPFPEARVILCDGRNLDPGEKQSLAALDVSHITDIHSLNNHPLLARPLYIHFDVDIINPHDAPAMSYRTPGGPFAVELRLLFRSLAEERQITAVSLSAWNPELDPDGHSQVVCMELLNILVKGE